MTPINQDRHQYHDPEDRSEMTSDRMEHLMEEADYRRDEGRDRDMEKSAIPVSKYSIRSLKWAHIGEGGWMSEFSTNIEIEDEGAGEFLLLTQPFASTKLSNGGVAITAEEWPTLRAAIESAFREIAQYGDES